MKFYPAYIKGVNPATYMSGQWGKIIGVKVGQDKNEERICYEVEYINGVVDYIPLIDAHNYVISSHP